MAKTLEEIEISVRRYAGDDTIVLTTDPGNSIFNAVYRDIASQLPWAEFRVKKRFRRTTAAYTTAASADQLYEDTVLGKEHYQWSFESVPLACTAIVHNRFIDVKAIELTVSGPVILVPPESEMDWNLAGGPTTAIAQPRMYMREYDATRTMDAIAIRPRPSVAGLPLYATGIIEPEELTALTDRTRFIVRAADDALERVVAAVFQNRRGDGNAASSNIQNATSILQRLHNREVATKELVTNIVRGQSGANA